MAFKKTYHQKKETIEKKWYVFNAEGKTLGRFASKIAMILQGKNKAIYTPSVNCGDYVIVVNAEKIKLTGNKLRDKVYISHTFYPGGLKETPMSRIMEKYPERIIELAVKRMLPKTNLGRLMLKKLKIYKGPEHPHKAQQPEAIEL
ncbi:MAG: 50S ribosomal protein L13 [Candidatus Hydrogenedentota bacterium]